MKKLLSSVFIAASLFTVSELSAQVITFNKSVHDYGDVKYGENAIAYFEVKNTGKDPLIISKAQSSCGCTVPTWPKEPIAPGASHVIQVKYDTKRVGNIAKTVTITSNAINEPTVVLKIKGTVLPAPQD